jgi:hypothetical protein
MFIIKNIDDMIIHYITVLIILFLFLDNYIILHVIRLANCNFNQILNLICWVIRRRGSTAHIIEPTQTCEELEIGDSVFHWWRIHVPLICHHILSVAFHLDQTTVVMCRASMPKYIDRPAKWKLPCNLFIHRSIHPALVLTLLIGSGDS